MARGGISHNAGDLVRKMLARKAAVVRELSGAARELAPLVSAESKRILQADIYDVPIPLKAGANKRLKPTAKIRLKTTKGKLGQWQRTGDLKRKESFRTDGPTIILTNNSDHALARYRLGTPGGRKIVTAGVRSIQWQAQAVANKRTIILARRRKAVLKALETG